MKSKSRNKLSAMLAVAGACVLVVGVFAYFTDYVTTKDDPFNITIAEKGIEIDPVTPPEVEPDPDDPGKTIEYIWDYNNPDTLGDGAIVAPGDMADLSYELENKSAIAIDVRETIVLTSSVALNQANPEYRLFLDATADAYGAQVGGTVVATEDISEYSVKYTIDPFVLNGTEETVAGATSSKQLAYKLVFDKYAANKFQGSTCTVDYLVEVKQHSEDGPAGGWTTLATSSTTLGGQTVSAVPAAPSN